MIKNKCTAGIKILTNYGVRNIVSPMSWVMNSHTSRKLSSCLLGNGKCKVFKELVSVDYQKKQD